MDSLCKAKTPNRNFKRLFWCDHKNQIKEIIKTVNQKYLLGLKKKFMKSPKGNNGTRLYLRYSGYEFQISYNTLRKELKRRENVKY